jgi:CheY-like chemotaxis protein
VNVNRNVNDIHSLPSCSRMALSISPGAWPRIARGVGDRVGSGAPTLASPALIQRLDVTQPTESTQPRAGGSRLHARLRVMALNQPARGRHLSPLPAAAQRSPAPRILLVDGDSAVADLTRRVLRRHGFNVVAARDGVEAIKRWAADEPDLVLLEVNLAGRNGFQVCEDIRRQSRTPVIMLTTRRDEEDVLRAFEVGADDYITKPFSPLQLVMRIGMILRRKSSS